MITFGQKNLRVCAVIAAGGSSSRMGFDKLAADLMGESVLMRSVMAFERCSAIDEIVVVARAEMADDADRLLTAGGIKKLKCVADGGQSRQQSAFNGVSASSEDIDIVCIHDGARPLVTEQVILDALEAAARYGAATAAVPVKDTIKRGGAGFVAETLPRESLYSIQTPQVFLKQAYLEAYKNAGKEYTDDCQLFEAQGRKVALSKGDYRNLKLTTAEDLAVAQAILSRMEEER